MTDSSRDAPRTPPRFVPTLTEVVISAEPASAAPAVKDVEPPKIHRSLPILTEVVEWPVPDEPQPTSVGVAGEDQPASPPEVAEVVQRVEPGACPELAPPVATGELAELISQRVLEQLRPGLHQLVSDAVSMAVQAHLEGLTERVRHAVDATLLAAIEQAVAEDEALTPRP